MDVRRVTVIAALEAIIHHLMTFSRYGRFQIIYTKDHKGHFNRALDYSQPVTNLNIKSLLRSLCFAFCLLHNQSYKAKYFKHLNNGQADYQPSLQQQLQQTSIQNAISKQLIKTLDDLEDFDPLRKFLNIILYSQDFPTPAS
jgi:hypothetical protein